MIKEFYLKIYTLTCVYEHSLGGSQTKRIRKKFVGTMRKLRTIKSLEKRYTAVSANHQLNLRLSKFFGFYRPWLKRMHYLPVQRIHVPAHTHDQQYVVPIGHLVLP